MQCYIVFDLLQSLKRHVFIMYIHIKLSDLMHSCHSLMRSVITQLHYNFLHDQTDIYLQKISHKYSFFLKDMKFVQII